MNSKTRALHRLYDKLDHWERFRLAVAACARDDTEEMTAIRRTAPKKTYSMIAWPYAGMMDGIMFAALALEANLLGDGLKACLFFFLDWVREVLGDERKGYFPDPWEMATEAAEAVKADWHGFALFCEGLGITVEDASGFIPKRGLIPMVIRVAEMVLEAQAQAVHTILVEQLPCLDDQPEGEQGIDVFQEWLERREQRQAEAAQECADLLRALWNQVAQLDGDQAGE